MCLLADIRLPAIVYCAHARSALMSRQYMGTPASPSRAGNSIDLWVASALAYGTMGVL